MFEEYFENKISIPLKIKRSSILQVPGKIASKAYYVKKGLLRSYTIDENGKMHIFMFAPEGWIISDIESHTLSIETELYIDALEDSEIIQVNQITIDSFTLVDKKNNQMIEKLLRRIAVLQRRVILMMSASAKQRYEHFLDTYPQLLDRVPQKMIASYLGITPEALSNIRSKMQ